MHIRALSRGLSERAASYEDATSADALGARSCAQQDVRQAIPAGRGVRRD